MTIYEIPGTFKESVSISATLSNVPEGFHCTGIWPFQREIFQDHEFSPSLVTDRPLDTTFGSPPAPHLVLWPPGHLDPPLPTFLQSVGLHPKAGPRKLALKGWKCRTTAILTDTPEKEASETEKTDVLLKKAKKRIEDGYKKEKEQKI